MHLSVLEEGYGSAGDELVLLARRCARWTIAEINDLTYAREARAMDSVADGDRHELADCAALTAAWRKTLERGLR